jgi:ABC-type lipoprotein export system ATPase subunit
VSGAFLEAVSVTRRFRDGESVQTAIDAVSLGVEPGSFVSIAGPSGSGKSTLLGLLGGIITPTDGDVKIAGESIVAMRDHHRTRHRRDHVGVLLQGLALVPTMSVLENVLLPLVPTGGARHEDVERARALLERMSLTEKERRPSSLLSGGERQRAAIARALITRPRALLLDEPTAHLDDENAKRVLDLLAELKDSGHAILIATHDPRVLARPDLTRIERIDGGRLVAT